MTHTFILSSVTFVYFGAFLLYLLQAISQRESWGTGAFRTLLVGFTAQTIALGMRWADSYRLGIGHAPLSNFYESLVFFAWAMVLLYLLTEMRTKSRSAGIFVTPLALLCMAYASFSPNVNSGIQPLVPALQSNWLIIHVVSCFLAYAAFAIAFALAIMVLLKNQGSGQKRPTGRFLSLLPEKEFLDDLLYHNVFFGFILLTLGIVTGSIWAHHAWGSYWSWDPKETWSLATWLIYAILLHARLVRGWRGEEIAALSLFGFFAVLFTYFGANYLSSLHAYLKF